jgi:hypothetical protein
MKRTLTFVLVLSVLFCTLGLGKVHASGGVLLKTEDTGRYQIVVLRTSNTGSAGPNEVILLDKDTGRTWTLQSEDLTKGWVLMPREDKARE